MLFLQEEDLLFSSSAWMSYRDALCVFPVHTTACDMIKEHTSRRYWDKQMSHVLNCKSLLNLITISSSQYNRGAKERRNQYCRSFCRSFCRKFMSTLCSGAIHEDWSIASTVLWWRSLKRSPLLNPQSVPGNRKTGLFFGFSVAVCVQKKEVLWKIVRLIWVLRLNGQ